MRKPQADAAHRQGEPVPPGRCWRFTDDRRPRHRRWRRRRNAGWSPRQRSRRIAHDTVPDGNDGPMIEPIDPAGLPASSAAYTHGTLVQGAQRTLFISGQPPWTTEGDVPAEFDAQCRLAWANVISVLAEAGMTVRNLAKVT